jgi:signal transduction histidine kinase
MRGYLEALIDGIVPPSPETFSLLQSETLRLSQLTEDVLQLARAEAARGDLDCEPTDLRAEVARALEPFSRLFSQKSVRVGIHAPEGPVTVSADRRRIARVLRNLTDNAARYAPRNGALDIKIEAGPESVWVEYANNSADLAPGDLPYLFERFYRGEKSRSREHGGAGIGLAIVKELVEAHGGRVGAELSGEKVAVWFELPVQPAHRPV